MLMHVGFFKHPQVGGQNQPTHWAHGALPLVLQYAPEHALVADYLHDDWDSDLVMTVLDSMRPGAGLRVDLLSSTIKAGDLTEPWFQVSGGASRM